ncbi:MAG TPA: metallophosphoesterase [Opitutus sp.]|nr:metallophosphoesterase [Opitutus sp.]
MTLLHVTDFHFNQRWFDWLLHRAPPHDVVVMSGDLLDLTRATPQRRQIEWVSAWLRDFPRPLSLCSGNHDLEWDSERGRWRPAYWLREVVNPLVWTDGQRVSLDGVSMLNLGATSQPKGGHADVWVVHAPPAGTLVAATATGDDAGDPDLVAAVRRYAPRLVLSGHVHSPLAWQAQSGGTLLLNPGYDPDAPFPNHILIQTESMTCRLVTARDGASRPSGTPLAAENEAALAA